MTELAIPELSLVVLVGTSGSGKSTFAGKHFGRFEVLASDYCRGLVSDDENDQAATAGAFDVLQYIAGKRLDAGKLTVIDATNVQRGARKPLIDLARAHDVLPVAIVLDVPESVCVARNADRTDRSFGAAVVRRQHDQLRRSVRGLAKEGFRKVHVLRGVDEVDAAQIIREKLLTDYREETGPFDIIGDIHGCRGELEALLTELGYELERDGAGRAIDARAPDGRKAVFVGDLVDRGPDSPGVLRLVMGMVGNGHALAVPGNHEQKLVRALQGRKVTVSHGLAETLDQLAVEGDAFTAEVKEFCFGLVSHLVLDGGNLVVAHAGLKEAYHGRASGRVRSFALYGDTTGETDEFGLPVRYPWAEDYRGRAMVVYGHTPIPKPLWVNNTICLDTGCVFGGRLTALRYPEKQLVSVPAERTWYEPVKPLHGVERSAEELELSDVTGKRVIETEHHGRITVREENAAGALEVMSRYAIHPKWLLYLPPTMAPCATAKDADLLEHPSQAFEQYRRDGISQVVCQEKHMGSRAVVLLCRDDGVAKERFDASDGETGAVYTRTGRPFFDRDLSEQLLGRLRAAADAAGLWSELDASWLLFDGELLPWSAKAEALLRTQYAAVGAAATSALSAATSALQQAAERGLDVETLLDRTRSRASNAAAFADVYRRYCWSTDGLTGVEFAPFQVLASSAASYHDRAHDWHLAIADRLATVDPALVRTTRRLAVDTDDTQSVASGTAWWEELTGAGGEGMVVKPLGNAVRGRRSLAQPGVKVRGREYLRLIYGPDYTEPDNLRRLRDRSLGHKRSMALREYTLGLEALRRAVDGEPVWRVHEAVFAVLALESEPVDPRL